MEHIGKQILKKMGASDRIMYLQYSLFIIDLDSIEDHGILLVTFIFIASNCPFETVGVSFHIASLS